MAGDTIGALGLTGIGRLLADPHGAACVAYINIITLDPSWKLVHCAWTWRRHGHPCIPWNSRIPWGYSDLEVPASSVARGLHRPKDVGWVEEINDVGRFPRAQKRYWRCRLSPQLQLVSPQLVSPQLVSNSSIREDIEFDALVLDSGCRSRYDVYRGRFGRREHEREHQ